MSQAKYHQFVSIVMFLQHSQRGIYNLASGLLLGDGGDYTCPNFVANLQPFILYLSDLFTPNSGLPKSL